jgi:hypothetical protein
MFGRGLRRAGVRSGRDKLPDPDKTYLVHVHMAQGPAREDLHVGNLPGRRFPAVPSGGRRVEVYE